MVARPNSGAHSSPAAERAGHRHRVAASGSLAHHGTSRVIAVFGMHQRHPARQRRAAPRVVRHGLARSGTGLVSASSDPLANSALEPTDTPRYALDLSGRGASAVQRESLGGRGDRVSTTSSGENK